MSRQPMPTPRRPTRSCTRLLAGCLATMTWVVAAATPAAAQDPGDAASPAVETIARSTTGLPAAALPPAAAYRQVLEAHAPAVVTVRLVLKVELSGAAGASMGEDQETESEVTGLMIDPAGLVVCSNTAMGGMVGLMARLLGSFGEDSVATTPTRIRVLLPGDDEGLPGRLVARDSDLDLAWIAIDPPADGGAHDLAAVELDGGVEPEIGQPFVALRRTDKLFDRAAVFVEGRIGGAVSKPRRLYLPATGTLAVFGLPVFSLDGSLLGMTVLQLPEGEDLGLAGMGTSFDMTRLGEMLAAVILPASELARATGLARELAAEESGGETPAEDETEAPAEGETPG